VWELLNKRLYGYLSWRFHRRSEHRSKVLNALLQDLQRTKPDHIVITGDLTHLGLPSEFQKASQLLRSMGSPSQVTVIPGNHDAYVATVWNRTFALWEGYMLSDGMQLAGGTGANLRTVFPSLRIRGRIALIGVSSALPTVPFLAIGSVGHAQLQKLEQILAETGRQRLFRVVLIHHPPLLDTVGWRKRLTDGAAFRSVLGRHGTELVLHGHVHRSSVSQLETNAGSAPAIGVPSASAIGRKPDRRARYHVYRLAENVGGWDVSISVRVYSPEEDCLLSESESRLTLYRPVD
jgi:3',5'-cyclic AMP phosphodiesterase CpdA